MYYLDEQWEKNKKEFTPVFQECLELIKEDYEFALAQLDTCNYLNKEVINFKGITSREHLIKKVIAYRSLFPFFEE